MCGCLQSILALFQKWIPQNDLLGHNKTKLFITHAGNNGQFEALYHGVPMLAIPLFGEQPYNAKRMVYKEYGIYMKLYEIEEEKMLSNINELLHNGKYRNNIQKGRAIYRSRQEKPIDRVVYWTEHVIRHGGNHLRSHALDMPWYEFIMLDILAFLFGATATMVLLLYFFIRAVYRKIVKSRKAKTD